MTKSFLIALLVGFITSLSAQSVRFIIETSYGNMEGELYDDTPKHRDNFAKLVKEGWYDESPFHRVINNFMIQGGGNKDGRTDPGYKVPAEFLPHKYVHLKGQLAAARMGDQVNQKKESSGSQFYIVQGRKQNPQQLQMLEEKNNYAALKPLIDDFIFQPKNAAYRQRIDSLQKVRDYQGLQQAVEEVKTLLEAEGKQWQEFHYSEAQKAAYQQFGGTPHLDGTYTIFGRITKGLEIIDKIAAVKTAGANEPVKALTMKIRLLD